MVIIQVSDIDIRPDIPRTERGSDGCRERKRNYDVSFHGRSGGMVLGFLGSFLSGCPCRVGSSDPLQPSSPFVSFSFLSSREKGRTCIPRKCMYPNMRRHPDDPLTSTWSLFWVSGYCAVFCVGWRWVYI